MLIYTLVEPQDDKVTPSLTRSDETLCVGWDINQWGLRRKSNLGPAGVAQRLEPVLFSMDGWSKKSIHGHAANKTRQPALPPVPPRHRPPPPSLLQPCPRQPACVFRSPPDPLAPHKEIPSPDAHGDCIAMASSWLPISLPRLWQGCRSRSSGIMQTLLYLCIV